jgi:hypothetical protein
MQKFAKICINLTNIGFNIDFERLHVIKYN